MNKALNKYGKAKWLSIRLSKPSRLRDKLKLVRARATLAVGSATLSQIRSATTRTEEDKARKKAAIDDCIVRTSKAISDILEGK